MARSAAIGETRDKGARALEACFRAGVEVVIKSGRREAQVMAAMRHPGIVRLFELLRHPVPEFRVRGAREHLGEAVHEVVDDGCDSVAERVDARLRHLVIPIGLAVQFLGDSDLIGGLHHGLFGRGFVRGCRRRSGRVDHVEEHERGDYDEDRQSLDVS